VDQVRNKIVCTECQEQLSEYIDGALELGEQAKLERHLEDCESCRAVRDDLLQIVHFSHQLPLQSPSSPLWPRIQSGLDELKPSIWSWPVRWFGRLRTRNFNLSFPQIIAATAALVIVVSIGIISARRESPAIQTNATGALNMLSPSDTTPLSKTDVQQLEKQISRLSETVELRKENWDPELRTAFERNLLYIDQSLVECRHQLKVNPADDISQELMLTAYREKVRLLEGFEKF